MLVQHIVPEYILNPFNSSGSRGIAAGLGNIQKLKDGEALGGRTIAADDFDTVEEDDFLS